MPAKVTRSAKPAPKPPPPKPKVIHKPTFPIREPAKTNLEPINRDKVHAHYVGTAGFHGWIWAQYLCFGALLLTVLWGGFYIHRTLALAEVGALTCSSENSLMWLESDPDSNVPRLNDAVMNQCAKAYNPLG